MKNLTAIIVAIIMCIGFMTAYATDFQASFLNLALKNADEFYETSQMRAYATILGLYDYKLVTESDARYDLAKESYVAIKNDVLAITIPLDNNTALTIYHRGWGTDDDEYASYFTSPYNTKMIENAFSTDGWSYTKNNNDMIIAIVEEIEEKNTPLIYN